MAGVDDYLVHLVREADEAVLTFFTGIRHGGSKYGLGIKAKGFTGWGEKSLSGEAVRQVERHGTLLGRRRRDAQTVSIRAVAEERTDWELDQLERTVLGFLAEGDKCRLQVQKSDGTLWAPAVLEAVSFTPRGYAPKADVELDLLLPDSIRYGQHEKQTATSGTAVAVANRGTLHAWPIITVTATTAMPGGYGLRLKNSAGAELGYLRIKAALASGKSHRIDMAKGRVYADGVIVWQARHSGTSWFVPRDQICSFQVEPISGTASAVIEFDEAH
ncbi:hypothetical protein [Pseudoclavibacter sp. VKM Ac-2888]|uniref:hypothetical protein n=1 Tax=Pseudoclavibacter sp. VKM Ac-2888 TaxID=2783830 RepID=UPI00188C9BEB|nr:hypothetical protein [Pseudoclavibacter sp. VKM Ac-2888]MBF4549231.1 hypothetical protein [Pseudoclavibacter sp. VKM Ac-2888]